MSGHKKLHGLTRTRQRFQFLEVGNRLSRSLTALVVLPIAGKFDIAINLVHLHVSVAHTLTRFIDGQGASARRRCALTQPPYEKVRYWHLADVDADAQHVRFQG